MEKIELVESLGLLNTVRRSQPLVHHITNKVTVNDVANMTMQVGGSPVMAEDPEEVEEMVATASALVMNIGTLDKRVIGSMLKGGRKANELGVPVLFDPVGIGATRLRNRAALEILSHVEVDVIKGNAGELLNLLEDDQRENVRGVDSAIDASVGLSGISPIFRNLATRYQTCIVMTGETDLVTTSQMSYQVLNGHGYLSKLTGTGCMVGSAIATFMGAGFDSVTASLAGLATIGGAAELAVNHQAVSGPMSFKTALFDTIFHLSDEGLKDLARCYLIEETSV